MLRWVVVAAVVTGCQFQATHLSLGTRVPMAELERHGGELPAFIQAELDRGEYARAFYALELDKTRPYSQEALAAADKTMARLATKDLRPVFLAMQAGDSATPGARGLVLAQASSEVTQQQPRRDAAFWLHMKKFEKHTAPLNPLTSGIPYDYAARHGYGVSSAEESGRLFGPDEAFVSFFVNGDRVTVFVVVRGALHVKPLATTGRRLREQVQRLLKRVRAPPEPRAETAWRADARALHEALLGPIEPLLGERTTGLFVSPHGFLANLPFGLLVDARDRVVLETRRVTYVPSASIYRQLLARPILNRPPRMLAVGNAVYPEGVDALAAAELEAVTVSELFPESVLLRGSGATERDVSQLARSYNILHFATHGVLLGRSVPGGSSLLVTADDTHDGFFSAAEIAGLDLSHTYVAVLSACETSVSDDSGRSIDLGTLTNAFLTAGSPSVIGTQWQVHDAATTKLMIGFYEQFLEVGAGEALRRAQLALRKDPRFAHPYYWGAFALFGWDK